MKVYADWSDHHPLASLLFDMLELSDFLNPRAPKIDRSWGVMTFNLELTPTEAILTFDEDCDLSCLLYDFGALSCFLSWGETYIFRGIGAEVAAECGATVETIFYDENDDMDLDTMSMTNIPPGPDVPPLHTCSIPLKGKIFRIPLPCEALQGIF